MSNVIKKVFNTEKPEAEANKAQDAVNGAENNVHRGEGFLGDAKEKLSNLVPHHHQNAQSAAAQAPQSATASQVPASASVSQGVPAESEAIRTQVQGVPASESDAFGRSGMTQTTSVNSGVNVAAGECGAHAREAIPQSRDGGGCGA